MFPCFKTTDLKERWLKGFCTTWGYAKEVIQLLNLVCWRRETTRKNQPFRTSTGLCCFRVYASMHCFYHWRSAGNIWRPSARGYPLFCAWWWFWKAFSIISSFTGLRLDGWRPWHRNHGTFRITNATCDPLMHYVWSWYDPYWDLFN